MKVKQLTLSCHERVLIDDLSVEMKKGEFWAILGQNGSGKTTLLQTLAGFKPYSTGEVQLDSKELKSYSPLFRAQKIAYLSQLLESGLNCTVQQSVSYGRYAWHLSPLQYKQDEEKIQKALIAMKLEKLKEKNIQQISGGELRKVEIATLLAQDSDIFMLDEPLNHLDMAFRFHLMKILKEKSKNKLIIMVTHDIHYVQAYCSNVIMLLNQGQTLLGTTKEILTPNNISTMLDIKLTPEQLRLI